MESLNNNLNYPAKVAIQGGLGAFHEIAAVKLFKNKPIKIIPCNTFHDVFITYKKGLSDYALVAIENSITGSLLQNYTMLRQSNGKICGEVYLRIEQHLMALPGQTIDNIFEIQSHPVAIEQCSQFLTPLINKGIRITETIDTALSAKKIYEESLKGVAAIASKQASYLYHLNIIKHNIETSRINYTRFLLIGNIRKKHAFQDHILNKASLCLKISHKTGSLAKALKVIASNNLNLTKIESMPITGTEWHYLFYTDVMFKDYALYLKTLQELKSVTEEIEILGEYKNGE